MTTILVLLIYKRGNLVAILSILMYTCADALKGYLLSDYNTDISATATVSKNYLSISDLCVQITYNDCDGTEQSLSLKYSFTGLLYCIVEIMFKAAHFTLACIFLFTAIKLGTSLELAKISKEHSLSSR